MQAPGSSPDHVPFISAARLEALAIPARDVADAIERMIRGQVEGRAWVAPKSVVTPPDKRYVMATLGVSDDPPVAASKLLVLNLRNSAKGLPDANSLVTLLHSETGVPLAVLEGNWVTAVRTAGLSAVAARRMARPDSRVLGFVGCGVQARSHLDAMCELFPVAEVHAFGRGAANRDALLRAAEALGLKAVAAESTRAAVAVADIVVSSVSVPPHAPPPPFLDAHWVKPGAFVTFVDLAGVWFPESMVALDRIVIDDLAQEKEMPRKLVDPALVTGDLVGLVTGSVVGRASAAERNGFAFRGVSIGDLAVAALAWQRAVACDTIPG